MGDCRDIFLQYLQTITPKGYIDCLRRLPMIYVNFDVHHYVEYGDVRISGGGSYGRLEFRQSDGTWGTICNRGFNDKAAEVACNQLGYDGSNYYIGVDSE